MKKVAVMLAGCGVYDGSEIHEAVFTLLHLKKNGLDYHCFAPDKNQFHVVNHLTGEVLNEERNVLLESARIARGEASPLSELTPEGYDGLVIPGGFGAAKNLNQWALKGKDGDLDSDVEKVIKDFFNNDKPLLGLCMGPTVIAQALRGTGVTVTVGEEEDSSYEINDIKSGIESLKVKTKDTTVESVCVDAYNKVVTAPCYMMNADIVQVESNIEKAVKGFRKLIL